MNRSRIPKPGRIFSIASMAAFLFTITISLSAQTTSTITGDATVQFDLKNPYLNVYSLSIQRELPWETLATLAYAGTRGVHLLRSNDVNIAIPIIRSAGTPFFPQNTAFSTIELKSSDGNSWYNALIFDVRKRWSSNFTLQTSYTFSRNIDTTQASTFFSDATNGTTTAFPEFPDLNYNKGLADFHAKHNWVVNFIWDLPLRETRPASRSICSMAGNLRELTWHVAEIR